MAGKKQLHFSGVAGFAASFSAASFWVVVKAKEAGLRPAYPLDT